MVAFRLQHEEVGVLEKAQEHPISHPLDAANKLAVRPSGLCLIMQRRELRQGPIGECYRHTEQPMVQEGADTHPSSAACWKERSWLHSETLPFQILASCRNVYT